MLSSTNPAPHHNTITYKSPLLAQLAASNVHLPTSPPNIPTSSPLDLHFTEPHASHDHDLLMADFVSPFLPRELQDSMSPVKHIQPHLQHKPLHHQDSIQHNPNHRSKPHAPFQPVHHAHAVVGNREYEQLVRIYGWQESNARTSGSNRSPNQVYGNHLLASSSVNVSTPTTPDPSVPKDHLPGWSGFLGKFRYKPTASNGGKPSPGTISSELWIRGTAPGAGALQALSSLAKRTAFMSRDPLNGAGGSNSGSRRGSTTGPLAVHPDSVFPAPPPLSPLVVGNQQSDQGSFSSFNNEDDPQYSNPFKSEDMDQYVVHADASQVILSPRLSKHELRSSMHRRTNSDQTVHSVSSSPTVPTHISATQPASFPDLQLTSIHRTLTPQPGKRDSGFLVDSGIHRDSTDSPCPPEGFRQYRKGSMDSSANPPRRSVMPRQQARMSVVRSSAISFRTYRLTQEFSSSCELVADDDTEVALDEDDDDETLRASEIARPARNSHFVPPPRSSSYTNKSTAPLTCASTAPAAHEPVAEPAPASEVCPVMGDFDLPPSMHPFWTNPRIFDSPSAHNPKSRLTVSKPGEVPPVIWEVSPIDGSKKLMAATPVKLIEVLTTTLDYQFLTDFFLVYRAFMSPLQLALMLILRFRWAMTQPNSEEHALVRFRTFIVLRHWITDYYIQDFAGSRPLRYLMIITFINAIAEDPSIRSHPRDYRLVKTLKRLLRAQDQEYKHLKQLHARTATPGSSLGDLAGWVHQLSVEKHFEAVYSPILGLVKESSDGYSRDSGISRTTSSSGHRPAPLRGSNMSTGSTTSAALPTTFHQNGSAADVPVALAALVCTKRSFLLQFKLETIAEQFLLIEEMMLLSIPWSSLTVHASQAGKEKLASPPNGSADRGPVQAMIDRFNATCQWVATEVCNQKNMEDRVKVIEKLIRLAVRSQHYGNLSTVNQIALGLQNPYVERLRKTWSKVSSLEKRQLRDLITLTAPMKNFSPLRAAMAAELERGNGIPFTGILLSDLVYNREMPSKLGKSTLNLSHLTAPLPSALSMPSTSYLVVLPVINYHKFRVMASTLDQFRQFQRIKRPPGTTALDLPVYANCLCLHTVPNNELQRMSYECERKS